MINSYLITKNDRNFDCIFQVDNDIIEQVEFGDFSYIDLSVDLHPDLSYALPIELYEPIIETLFLKILRNRDFEYAFQLTQITKSITKKIYNSILDDLPNDIVITVSRLYKVLRLLETIDDDFLTEFPTSFNKQFLNLYTRSGVKSNNIELWDFLPYLTIDQYYSPNILPTPITARSRYLNSSLFRKGPLIADLIWIRGVPDERGIFVGEEVQNPVFLLNILSPRLNMMIGPGANLKPFLNLRNILKFIYGQYATTYLMLNPDNNPFVTQSDFFIKI